MLTTLLIGCAVGSIYPVDVTMTKPKMELLSEGPMYAQTDAPLGADPTTISVVLDMIPVTMVSLWEARLEPSSESHFGLSATNVALAS